jgi:hypothetical protein
MIEEKNYLLSFLTCRLKDWNKRPERDDWELTKILRQEKNMTYILLMKHMQQAMSVSREPGV